MRCTSCHRNVAAGVEAQKMIVEYRQPDGSVKVFGFGMSDGPVSTATGQMVKGFHYKCFWIAKKREAKGDAVTGRVVNSGITGYNIDTAVTDETLLHVTAQTNRMRRLAEQMGKGVGDPQVQEAFVAAERGGPYTHHHAHRLDVYQLIAHLEYAHGMTDQRLLMSADGIHGQHAELHAKAALRLIEADRSPEDGEDRTTDWREQHTAVLE